MRRACATLAYQTIIPTPPSDRDWVDYTLFDVQSGYADSLATSMTVLLREEGVPARVVTGFAPGTYNEDEAAYIITEAEAHAWVEVFFPRYGWINFEPSVIRSLPFRPTEDIAIDLPTSDMCLHRRQLRHVHGRADYFDRLRRLHAATRSIATTQAWLIGLGVVVALLVAGGLAWFGMWCCFGAACAVCPGTRSGTASSVGWRAGPDWGAAHHKRRLSTPNGWMADTRAPGRWCARSLSATCAAPTAARSPTRRSLRAPRRPGSRSGVRWPSAYSSVV